MGRSVVYVSQRPAELWKTWHVQVLEEGLDVASCDLVVRFQAWCGMCAFSFWFPTSASEIASRA